MNLRKFVPLTGLALAASLALAGCAPSDSPEPEETGPSISVPATYAPGDTVDAAAADALNSGSQPGVRAYGLQDGSYLVISETEALPETVVADMRSRVAAVPTATAETSGEVDAQLGDFVFTAREQTGKDVVVLTYSWYPIGVDAGAPTQERWVHIGDVEGVVDPMADVTIRNREEYRAMLEAAQANDPDIVIIEHG